MRRRGRAPPLRRSRAIVTATPPSLSSAGSTRSHPRRPRRPRPDPSSSPRRGSGGRRATSSPATTRPDPLVTRVTFFVATSSTYRSRGPSRVETKAIRAPSGEYDGVSSDAALDSSGADLPRLDVHREELIAASRVRVERDRPPVRAPRRDLAAPRVRRERAGMPAVRIRDPQLPVIRRRRAVAPHEREPGAVARRDRDAVELPGRHDPLRRPAARVHPVDRDLPLFAPVPRRLEDHRLPVRRELRMRVAARARRHAPRRRRRPRPSRRSPSRRRRASTRTRSVFPSGDHCGNALS